MLPPSNGKRASSRYDSRLSCARGIATGGGDAFRAGLIFGIEKGYDWKTIGRMGNLMGALKVEHPGTQNQRFDYAEFAEQFRQQFGYALG